MPAAAATMKKLIETKSTPKSVEPWAAASASCRTGRKASPRSAGAPFRKAAAKRSASPFTATPVTPPPCQNPRTVSSDRNAFGAVPYCFQ